MLQTRKCVPYAIYSLIPPSQVGCVRRKMKLQATQKRRKAATKNISHGKNGKFRVIIVDENTLCRRGLRELMREDGRFDIIAEADHGETGLKAILAKKPDVAVMDAILPGISGLEL